MGVTIHDKYILLLFSQIFNVKKPFFVILHKWNAISFLFYSKKVLP